MWVVRCVEDVVVASRSKYTYEVGEWYVEGVVDVVDVVEAVVDVEDVVDVVDGEDVT